MTGPIYHPMIEQALRVAADAHRQQCRKGTDIPYVYHVFAVAAIASRAGFTDPEIFTAALLHDVVEDTETTLDDLRTLFPADVVDIVDVMTEIKHDESGQQIPWSERKREHHQRIAAAPVAARAVALSDKLHNLSTILYDLQQGRDVWSSFNADRAAVLDAARRIIRDAGQGDPRLEALAAECRQVLREIEMRCTALM